MKRRISRQHSLAGLTLLELVITTALLSIFFFGIISIVVGLQSTFLQNQVLSDLNLRAQSAMDRIVNLSSQAVTVDAQFSPLKPTTGINSHCLRFRLIQSIDNGTGTVVYNDTHKIYIYGADNTDNPCNGIVIGRAFDLSTVYSTGKGVDNILGTQDDNTNAGTSGIPAVELLIPDIYAPQNGDMLTINVTGRLITFTMRLNAIGPDGNFVFPNDFVLTERVALRQ